MWQTEKVWLSYLVGRQNKAQFQNSLFYVVVRSLCSLINKFGLLQTCWFSNAVCLTLLDFISESRVPLDGWSDVLLNFPHVEKEEFSLESPSCAEQGWALSQHSTEITELSRGREESLAEGWPSPTGHLLTRYLNHSNLWDQQSPDEWQVWDLWELLVILQ